MAAQEQQDERVIAVRHRRRALLGQHPAGDRVLAALPGLLAAQQVGEPPPGDRDQPAPRIVRQTLLRPLRGGRQQRLLHGVLGGVEVAVPAHDRTEDLRREPAQQVLDGLIRHRGQTSSSALDSAIGRTSANARSRTHSGPGQSFSRAAISVARSKLSQSTIQ